MKVEIINLLNTILEQNYIEHNGKWYKQNDGLAMGAPTSAILAETIMQHLEHNNNRGNFEEVSNHRYVDDILIVYNRHKKILIIL
jgi:hypothetical protein